MIIRFYETFWEKDFLRINPDVLRELLLADATLEIHDPATNKVISYHAHDLLNIIKYDEEYHEYAFPVLLC